jgi:diguanylate cyclase (GGDEF)-like protein
MNTEANPCPQCADLRQKLAGKDREIALLLAKIQALVRHDTLTGTLNRRALIETLESELQRSKRTGHPFCFAVIDLDHFKNVNDEYGQPAGDAVLKTVSDAAVKMLRALDRFGRLDGGQFGIVLPATWLDKGVIAMARLRSAVVACDWQEIAPKLVLTFSAGITTNAFGDNAESIIKRAEKALSEAKQEGRDRTVQVEEALPDPSQMDLD